MTAKKTDEVSVPAEIKTRIYSSFEKLNGVNVNEHTEKKNGLTYLSWSWAWSEFKKAFPEAQYEVVKFDGIPYVYDEKTGYMVYTRVTADNITYEMWLPVMDSGNNAMKSEPYEIKTKYKTITVAAATMTDVNKTIMRCLVKNLAMFGLGLYIYSGEDLPEEEAKDTTKAAPDNVAQPTKDQASTKPTTASKPSSVRKELVDFCSENQINLQVVAKMFKLNNSASEESFTKALQYCKAEVKKRILAEAQESKAEDSTVKDILDNAGKFLEGIEEV